MKSFKLYLEGLDDLKKANRKKETKLRQDNRDKENDARRADMEKAQDKRQDDREKEIEKRMSKNKKESIIQKVTEYIKANGKRRKCAGGDGRRTENHDCDKVHSDMTHKEWEASQDTPPDEQKEVNQLKEYLKIFDSEIKLNSSSEEPDIDIRSSKGILKKMNNY